MKQNLTQFRIPKNSLKMIFFNFKLEIPSQENRFS